MNWFVKKSFILLVVCFFCSSCTASKKDEPYEIDGSYFNESKVCIEYWYKLYNDWVKATGGVAESIYATREITKEDNNSRLSELIKFSWAKQKNENTYRKKESLGEWPIAEEEYLRAFSFDQKQPAELIMRCGSMEYLADRIWRDLPRAQKGNGKAKLEETPNDMVWEYPDAAYWIMYWLFVNVE